MSVSRCLLPAALRAASTPLAEWKGQVNALPMQCEHPDVCTGGLGCRDRVAEYLRVQFQAQARRERMKRGGQV